MTPARTIEKLAEAVKATEDLFHNLDKQLAELRTSVESDIEAFRENLRELVAQLRELVNLIRSDTNGKAIVTRLVTLEGQVRSLAEGKGVLLESARGRWAWLVQLTISLTAIVTALIALLK